MTLESLSLAALLDDIHNMPDVGQCWRSHRLKVQMMVRSSSASNKIICDETERCQQRRIVIEITKSDLSRDLIEKVVVHSVATSTFHQARYLHCSNSGDYLVSR